MNFRKWIVISLTALTFVGCGGGGGASGGGGAILSSVPTSSLVSVSSSNAASITSSSSLSSNSSSLQLEFSKAGAQELFIGDILSNPISNLDVADNVVYSSNTPSIVSVDSLGRVKAEKVGDAIITAELKSNSSIRSSYVITVVARSVDFISLVGANSQKISLSSDGKGVRISKVCDLDDCGKSNVGIYDGIPFVDSSQGSIGDYLFEFGGKSVQVDTGNASLPALFYHQAVVFKGSLWVLGGQNGSSISSEILISKDGLNWNSRSSNVTFPGRQEHQVIEFNQKLWLIGGYGYAERGNYSSGVRNDVWSSDNGIDWKRQIDSAPFLPRRNHRVINFNGKIWLFGGEDSKGNKLSDLWVSDDGLGWNLVNQNLFSGNLGGFDIAVFQNKMWLAKSGKIWSSVDGVSWSEAATSAPFVSGNSLFVHDGKLWIGSNSSTPFWSSVDGVSWVSSSSFIFDFLVNYQVASFQGKIFVLGGYNPYKQSRLIVSTDGLDWKSPLLQSFSARNGHAVAQYKDALFMVGGTAENNLLNDVWKSHDGLVWTEVLSSAPFSKRTDLNLIEWNNRLFIVGGRKNDIWSTIDGSSWTLEVAQAEFPSGIDFELVSHAGQLWLFGSDNSVWVSSDAKKWKSKGVISSFTNRAGFKVASYKGEMVLIGGLQTSNREFMSDVWVSTDGINWDKRSNGNGLKPLAWHELTVQDNKLIVSGGSLANSQSSVVYSSEDGVNWQKLSYFPFGRSDHAVIAFDHKLIVTGGLRSLAGPLSDILVSENLLDWNSVFAQKIYFKE